MKRLCSAPKALIPKNGSDYSKPEKNAVQPFGTDRQFRPTRHEQLLSAQDEDRPHLGGQHAATIGTSTKDQTDKQRDHEAIAEFNDQLQLAVNAIDWSQPF